MIGQMDRSKTLLRQTDKGFEGYRVNIMVEYRWVACETCGRMKSRRVSVVRLLCAVLMVVLVCAFVGATGLACSVEEDAWVL